MQTDDLISPSPPRISDPVSDLVTNTTSPILTTTPPITVTALPTSPRPTAPPPSVTAPLTTSAPPDSAVASSALVPQAQPPRTTSSSSTTSMKTVDQFWSELSRTGHVGAEPDASYRFPIVSHGPMNVAYN